MFLRSGTPDECLTPLVSHPLDDLQFIDPGLGGQVGSFFFYGTKVFETFVVTPNFRRLHRIRGFILGLLYIASTKRGKKGMRRLVFRCLPIG